MCEIRKSDERIAAKLLTIIHALLAQLTAWITEEAYCAEYTTQPADHSTCCSMHANPYSCIGVFDRNLEAGVP